jgi:lysophospholipase L1-like esterase
VVVVTDATPSAESPLVVRVAFIGDSITEGNASHREGPTPKRGGGHVPLAVRAELMRRSAARGLICDDPTAKPRRVTFDIGIFAASGTTAIDRNKWSYRRRQTYTDALAFHPDIVVLMLGTNDAKNSLWGGPLQLASDLVTLASTFTLATDTTASRVAKGLPRRPSIVLGIPPPVVPGKNARAAGFNATTHNGFIRPAYAEAVAAFQRIGVSVTVVDYFQAFLAWAGIAPVSAHVASNAGLNALFVDGVHPTLAAHERMAVEFFNQLCIPCESLL